MQRHACSRETQTFAGLAILKASGAGFGTFGSWTRRWSRWQPRSLPKRGLGRRESGLSAILRRRRTRRSTCRCDLVNAPFVLPVPLANILQKSHASVAICEEQLKDLGEARRERFFGGEIASLLGV